MVLGEGRGVSIVLGWGDEASPLFSQVGVSFVLHPQASPLQHPVPGCVVGNIWGAGPTGQGMEDQGSKPSCPAPLLALAWTSSPLGLGMRQIASAPRWGAQVRAGQGNMLLCSVPQFPLADGSPTTAPVPHPVSPEAVG